jgi:3-hydroxyisobutyrate dehydrogenase-like beta-hydroxyacid dehydrogenase
METIGFIGLGLMGRPMAKNLLKAGHSLIVNSRSQGPVDDLVASGAARGATPADVARGATCIITMVPDSPDVELVLDGPQGVFTAMKPGTLVIDMSSISPGVARRLASRASELGGTMLDARSPSSPKRSRSHARRASMRRKCARRCSAASHKAACSTCTAIAR